MYDWAGQLRTVAISKGEDLFCLPQFLDRELSRRFDQIQADEGLHGTSARRFAARAAEHISELNAIHPFREGNGRTMRAFLKVLGANVGHELLLERITPREWNQASVESFRNVESSSLRLVIANALVDERQRGLAVVDAKLARREAGKTRCRPGR